MKLERIALHGFLSHQDTDWSPNGARLVSLVGPNGAGKSSLLDAIAYCLFDDARARTDDLVRIGQTEMSATIEFEYSGARYRVTRGRTTRAGGKGYLELAIADGEAWRPLTGDTMRDTQAKIAELLRMDADTFTTAALLMQGRANAFAEATAAERKRILGTVLGLDRYARAEARARELARDVEARSSVERDRLERVDLAIAELADVDEALEAARDGASEVEVELGEQSFVRSQLEERIRGLDVRLVGLEQAARDVAAVEARIEALRTRYKGVRLRRSASVEVIGEAEVAIAGAADVDAAAARLAKLRPELEILVAAEAEDRRARRALDDRRSEINRIHGPWQRELVAAQTQRAAAEARVDRLVADGKAGIARCETCGQAIGRDEVLRQLETARVAVKAIVDPKEPAGLALAEAELARLEGRLREGGFDADRLAALHREVAGLERTAARGEAIAAARATLERETAAIAAADEELAMIDAEGKTAAAELAERQALAAQADPLRVDRAAAGAELGQVAASIEQLERARREGERRIATLEANVARRDELVAERAELTASIERSSSDLHLLRRLVTAFGVTGIPARIIEGVLPELEAHANELLAELRPGMELGVRAQRAKRDGSGVVEALDLVVRDPAGERSLALFSGGERMSVSLAIAVGLSRLVARRAGTAIRTLIVDEPDGLDADARRAFGQALRVLAHQGELERVVLVSHHEDLAEFGDATYAVSKSPKGSVVEFVS